MKQNKPRGRKPSQAFSHVRSGGVCMVDVGGKAVTVRTARAEAIIELGTGIAGALRASGGATAKGSVVETARLAGIQAAKRTADLIPLCHPLPLDAVDVEGRLEGSRLRIETKVRCRARTVVEMEALTAAAVAALTVYDMCKSAGKGIEIRCVRLLEKTGGRTGAWRAPAGRDDKDPA